MLAIVGVTELLSAPRTPEERSGRVARQIGENQFAYGSAGARERGGSQHCLIQNRIFCERTSELRQEPAIAPALKGIAVRPMYRERQDKPKAQSASFGFRATPLSPASRLQPVPMILCDRTLLDAVMFISGDC